MLGFEESTCRVFGLQFSRSHQTCDPGLRFLCQGFKVEIARKVTCFQEGTYC